MRVLKHLFENNRLWAEETERQYPDFFERLSHQQSPEYLWLGCSDSRLPPNYITGLLPGELFVHRNLANVVVHTDFNCLSVVEYALAALNVKHIIVCGHYGCGGVQAALGDSQLGLMDNWLRHIRDVYYKHEVFLKAIPTETERLARICELNVVEQVWNLCNTTIVQSAWARGQSVAVHGWVYGIRDGLLNDLGVCITGPEEVGPIYRAAVASLTKVGSTS